MGKRGYISDEEIIDSNLFNIESVNDNSIDENHVEIEKNHRKLAKDNVENISKGNKEENHAKTSLMSLILAKNSFLSSTNRRMIKKFEEQEDALSSNYGFVINERRSSGSDSSCYEENRRSSSSSKTSSSEVSIEVPPNDVESQGIRSLASNGPPELGLTHNPHAVSVPVFFHSKVPSNSIAVPVPFVNPLRASLPLSDASNNASFSNAPNVPNQSDFRIKNSHNVNKSTSLESLPCLFGQNSNSPYQPASFPMLESNNIISNHQPPASNEEQFFQEFDNEDKLHCIDSSEYDSEYDSKYDSEYDSEYDSKSRSESESEYQINVDGIRVENDSSFEDNSDVYESDVPLTVNTGLNSRALSSNNSPMSGFDTMQFNSMPGNIENGHFEDTESDEDSNSENSMTDINDEVDFEEGIRMGNLDNQMNNFTPQINRIEDVAFLDYENFTPEQQVALATQVAEQLNQVDIVQLQQQQLFAQQQAAAQAAAQGIANSNISQGPTQIYLNEEDSDSTEWEMPDDDEINEYIEAMKSHKILLSYAQDLAKWKKTLYEWKDWSSRQIEMDLEHLKRSKCLHYLNFIVLLLVIIVLFIYITGQSKLTYYLDQLWQYGAFPAMILDVFLPFIVFLTPWPFEVARRPPPTQRERLSILIPTMGQWKEENREAHYEKIRKTLKCAVRYVGHELMSSTEISFPHIIVIDNAIHPFNRFMIPDPHLEHVVRSVHPSIYYIWVPFASKTLAVTWSVYHILLRSSIHVTEQQIKESPHEIPEYTIILDDDTLIPYDMPIPSKLYQPHVVGSLYPICAFKNQVENSWLCRMQDIEYKKSGANRLFQSSVGGFCIAPHGAISIWKTCFLMQDLQQHDGKFQGEDLQMGLIVYEHMPSKTFLGSGSVLVKTEACGTLKGLFRQRVRSWDVVPFRLFFQLAKLIIKVWGWNRILVKIYMFLEMWTIFQDIFRLFFIAWGIYSNAKLFAIGLLGLLIFNVLQLMLLNWFKIPEQHKFSTLSLYSYPFYSLLLLFFRLSGFIYNALIFDPRQRVSRVGNDLLAQNGIPYSRGIIRMAGILNDFYDENSSDTSSGWQYIWQLDNIDVLKVVISKLKKLHLDGRLFDVSANWRKAQLEKDKTMDAFSEPTPYYEWEGETDDDPDMEIEIDSRAVKGHRKIHQRKLADQFNVVGQL
eukprot:TRINITY_DN1455_c0_g1_i1.p1 TRINITY_DN1455_c0_g1~~TRINITY_DN1455_c0_g1_i1.p1  ORF type:complete len:1170 (+),score=274.03 TRINITY_DN1455_c0_g1_i1:52-3561(+)